MLRKLKSRKFLMSLSSALFIILSEGLGLHVPAPTYYAIAAVVIAYVLGEAYVDSRK